MSRLNLRAPSSLRQVALLAGLIAVSLVGGCSADSPGAVDHSLGVSYMMSTAPVAVVAVVVEAGSSGEVALRPVVWLEGTLPLDSEGLIRFSWHRVDDMRPGIWLFDASGEPWWDNAPYLEELGDWPDPRVPEFPWNVHSYDDPDGAVTFEWAVGENFPQAVVAEMERVQAEADVVVSLRGTRPPGSADEMDFMEVVAVYKGDGQLAVGDMISLRYADPTEWNAQSLNLDDTFALQLVDGQWTTVPSWWLASQSCLYVTQTKFPPPTVQVECPAPGSPDAG